MLSPRKQAKALIFGHTHRWSHEQRDADGLHLINLPACAYVFEPEQPSGWVDALVHPDGASLTLHTLDPKHPLHNRELRLHWRT